MNSLRLLILYRFRAKVYPPAFRRVYPPTYDRAVFGETNLTDLNCTCLEHPAAGGETFLAGDGEDVSTPELVRRIAAALGKPARLLPIPEWMMKFGGALTGKSAQVARLCGSLEIDSSKVRRLLGWTPPSSMAEELGRLAIHRFPR